MRKEQFSIGQLTVDNIIGGGVNAGIRRKIYLDPTAGSDGNDGLEITRALKTLAAARARITSGKSDAIIMVQGASSLSLAADPVISETCLSILGNAPGALQGMRSRIKMASDYGTPMLTLSGNGNLYSNLTIAHGYLATAVAKVGVLASGSYASFKNVHIQSPLSVGVTSDTAFRSLEVSGDGCRFERCVVGVNSVGLTGANALVQLDCGTNTMFEDCTFILNSLATAPYFFYVINTPSAPGPTIAQFKRCTFIAAAVNMGNGALPVAEAFKFTGGDTCAMIFDDACNFVNITKITASATNQFVWMPGVETTLKSLVLAT